MKKRIKYGILIIGVTLIISGVALMFTDVNKEKKENPAKEVWHQNKEYKGDKIDTSNYQEYSFLKDVKSSYLKGYDITLKNKLSFPIPSNTEEKVSMEYYRNLENETISVTAETIKVESEEFNFDHYLQKNMELTVTENKEIMKYNYLISDSFKNSDREWKLAKINFLTKSGYYEQYQILIKSSEEEFFFLQYQVKDKKLIDEELTNLLEKIKLEPNSATYLQGQAKDENWIGNLNIKNKDTALELKYQFSTDIYTEVEYEGNMEQQTRFVNNRSENDLMITLLIGITDKDHSIKEIVEETIKDVEALYGINMSNRQEENFVANDITCSIVKSSYQIEETNHYYALASSQISENRYILITFESTAEINSTDITEFLKCLTIENQ